MRKLLFIAITFACSSAFSQGNTLYDVSMVKTKMGSTAGFEKSWKAHVTKFHNGDDKRQVEEILSGNNTGNLLLISGPFSFADMDKERANNAAHDADYDATVVPAVASFTTEGVYRWVDTLSYNTDVRADKFITTVYHIKSGRQGEFISEIRRSLAVNKKINSPSSYNTYIKLWSGSSPEVVIVNNLKNGFKQLDNGFAPNMGKEFQTTYVQEYGQAMWDARLKLLPDITTSYETYISKVRKDLSSVRK